MYFIFFLFIRVLNFKTLKYVQFKFEVMDGFYTNNKDNFALGDNPLS